MKHDLTLVVLAAGIGSRYGGNKQLDTIGPNGELLLDYSIKDASKTGFTKVVLVIRPELEESFYPVKKNWEQNLDIEVDFAYQELSKLPSGYKIPDNRQKPWGTGHAVLCAKEKVTTPFAAINADDYYGISSYKVLADFFTNPEVKQNQYAMVAFLLQNTLSAYGPVSRGVCKIDKDNKLEEIIEHTKIQEKDGKIYTHNIENANITLNSFVSMNFWGFTPSIFEWLEKQFQNFLDNYDDILKKEFFLPKSVDDGIKAGKFDVTVLTTKEKWLGITYPEDSKWVLERLKSLEK